MVLIEIKGFEELRSPIEYLEAVLGQYVLYQAVIETLALSMPLFLAVPTTAYRGFLSEPICQIGLQKVNANLLVFDPAQEEIVQWIR